MHVDPKLYGIMYMYATTHYEGKRTKMYVTSLLYNVYSKGPFIYYVRTEWG